MNRQRKWMKALLPSPSPIDGRNAWVAAYHEWYYHYLAMQPCEDHLAVTWAHDMVRASLALYLRDDRDEIRRLAMALSRPQRPQESITISPTENEPKKHSVTPPQGQLSLLS